MKLCEVLESLKQSKPADGWFRPSSWNGLGQSYMLNKGLIFLVMPRRGTKISMTSNLELLAGDWEITTEAIVNDEFLTV